MLDVPEIPAECLNEILDSIPIEVDRTYVGAFVRNGQKQIQLNCFPKQ